MSSGLALLAKAEGKSTRVQPQNPEPLQRLQNPFITEHTLNYGLDLITYERKPNKIHLQL